MDYLELLNSLEDLCLILDFNDNFNIQYNKTSISK